MKKFVQAFFLSLLLTFTFSTVALEARAQGCIMCKAQVGESKDEEHAKKVGASLNTGILYLVAIPYLLVATVGFIWYRQSRNKENS